MAKTKTSTQNKILLASSSPRRRMLLADAGYRFTISKPNVREDLIRGESPVAMVKRLAKLKAFAVNSNKIVIGSDTAVVAPNGKTILGKPRSRREAVRMIRMLQGKTHTVLTGYCIRQGKQLVVRAIRTRVTFEKLSNLEIESYVRAGESMDKAGAYAAQGAGMILIKKISGSYSNVVGLPMTELVRDLRERFGVRLFG